MDGQNSAIMRETLKYCIAYIIILGAKIGIIYHPNELTIQDKWWLILAITYPLT